MPRQDQFNYDFLPEDPFAGLPSGKSEPIQPLLSEESPLAGIDLKKIKPRRWKVRSKADVDDLFTLRMSELPLYGNHAGYYSARARVLRAVDTIVVAVYQATHRRTRAAQ